MIQNEKKDPLRNLDWSAVYGNVPEDFEPSVRVAFQRIRSAEKRRKNVIRFAACAAAVAVIACIGAWQVGKREFAPDHVDVVLAAPDILTPDAAVFATKDDPCFHIDPACPKTIKNEVQLQLVTALEFEKNPCPDCCVNVQFEE